jgi:dynein heavy chain, axonemal
VITLEKFAQKKPSVVMFDEKLTFYSKLARDVDGQLSVKDVDFMRIISSPLKSAIHVEAMNWIYAIGELTDL